MDIKKVLIVGAGNLGRQVAFQCATHGFETVMYNVRSQALELSRCDPSGIGRALRRPTRQEQGRDRCSAGAHLLHH